MNLKNYTTEVSAAKSIEAIERLLISFGASNIMKEYSPQKNIAGISFIIECKGMKLPFRLPAKVKEIYVWLRQKYPQRKDTTLLELAERVCWKQMWEWVHINLSLIELEQAETLEVFFPYLYDVQGQKTWYEQQKSSNYKALLPEKT